MKEHKRKILIFSPNLVYPPKAANQQDIAGRLSLFREAGFVPVLVQFAQENTESQTNEVEVHTLKRAKNNSKFQYYKAKGLEGDEVYHEVSRIIEKVDPEVLWFEYVSFAFLAERIKKAFPQKKIYFRSHNYESGHAYEKWRENWRDAKSISKKLRTLPGLIKNTRNIPRYEKKMFAVADQVLAISWLDCELYQKRYSVQNISYLPFYKEYSFHVPKKTDVLRAFYFGSDFANNVNRSGLVFLDSRVLSRFEDGDVQFHILGKNAPPVSDKRVHCEGFVDDLEGFLSQMDVSIVPVDIGYGMKIKAYESLRRGFPTIVSPRVHEVFGGKPGRDYFVCETPEEYREALRRLHDTQLRVEMGENARLFMEANFQKEKIMALLKEL